MVFGQRLRNKAVIRRIIHGRIKDPVEANHSAGLVEFVFHAGAQRNLDYRVEFSRDVLARTQVMPRMVHIVSLCDCCAILIVKEGGLVRWKSTQKSSKSNLPQALDEISVRRRIARSLEVAECHSAAPSGATSPSTSDRPSGPRRFAD